MTPMPSLTASSASASPTRTLRSSDSTTQGPAMRNGLLSAANRWAMSVGELCQFARRLGARMELLVIECGAHEAGEQRVRAHRSRLELRMELAADEPRMIGKLDHLDEGAIGRQAGSPQSILCEHIAIRVRNFVAMAVPFAHFRGVVCLCHPGARAESAGVRAQSHRAAHLLNPLLRAHQRDYWILALGRELARVRVGDLTDVARELDDGRLETEADPEERQLVLARPPNRLEHPLYAPHAEPPGHEQP